MPIRIPCARPLAARRRAFTRAAAAAVCCIAGLAASFPAAAQAWPSKPIKMMVGFPPGTATDIIARLIGAKLAENAGWTIVVENRPGQGGSLAADVLSKTAGDGYTLLMTGTAPMTTNLSLYSTIRYDPRRDFTPVTPIADVPCVLVVDAQTGPKNVAELIALAKERPRAINFGSSGNGTTPHLMSAMFTTMAGIELTHVPYRGTGESVAALLSGQIGMLLDTFAGTSGSVRAGKLRVIAVSPARRLTALPDVPTIAEAGVAGFDMSGWIGLVAPAGLPKDVLARLHAEVVKAMTAPDVKERLLGLGAEVMPMSPEQFGAFIRTEHDKWARAVKVSGAKVE